jgi:glycosyltransferase involved in cell wall biosynthesis
MNSRERKKRLAVITTHPIQYYSPIFRLLSERGLVDICVFYTWEREASGFDVEFGKSFEWDIPLLQGFEHVFVPNGGSERRDLMGVRNPGLEACIRDWGADAVLVFGWNYLSHLRAMRHFHGRIPVFFRGDSNLLDPRPGWKKSMRMLFLRLVYRYVDTAFYVGTRSREYFRAVGMREEALVFAPHAVDNERFSRQSREARERVLAWRGELGIGESETVFLFAGKFIDKKDPLLLMEAFIELDEENTHLVFIGDGILKDEMQRMASGNSRIHILPFQNQSAMPAAYALCDVFCLPSKGPGETWGLAVNEAMACGKAVLVSERVGCAVDLVCHAENGYVFRTGDKADLLGKMRLMLSTGSIGRMGERSAEKISSWNFQAVAEAIERRLTC